MPHILIYIIIALIIFGLVIVITYQSRMIKGLSREVLKLRGEE